MAKEGNLFAKRVKSLTEVFDCLYEQVLLDARNLLPGGGFRRVGQ
jgi:hypothetical protein